MPDASQDPGSLEQFERALSGLQLRKTTVDRDRLMFLAGQAAARRPTRFNKLWPAATVMVALVAGTLGHLSGSRTVAIGTPEPGIHVAAGGADSQVSHRVGQGNNGETSVAPRPEDGSFLARGDSSDALAYMNLRDSVARWGVDALPAPGNATGARPAAGYMKLRQRISQSGLLLEELNPTRREHHEANQI